MAPKVILYDEPTTGLDPIRSDVINELILKLQRELHVTSIVVTHDMRFARKLADRILFLHEGEARFFGGVEDLEKTNDPVLKEFLSMDELLLPT